MNKILNVGMTLYHKLNKTKCVITNLENRNNHIYITALPERRIASKSKVVFSSESIGEFLFFTEADVNTDAKSLCLQECYLQYNNARILRARDKILEEEKMKIQAAAKLEEERRIKELEKKKLEELAIIKKTLLDMWCNHGFDGFHHYTDFRNFISIMNSGKLYSRTKVKHLKLLNTDSAMKEALNHTSDYIKNNVRFYYRPKNAPVYLWEGIKRDSDKFDFSIDNSNLKYHMPVPVLLLFKEEILFHKDVEFADGNCSNYTTVVTNDPHEACECFDWKAVFDSSFHDKDDSTAEGIKRKRCAEFLYPNEISTEYLKKIIFRTYADYKNAVNIFGENSLFYVDTHAKKFFSYFNDDRIYLDDYNVSIGAKSVILDLSFLYNNCLEKFTHVLEITTKNQQIIKLELNLNDYVSQYINGKWNYHIDLSDYVKNTDQFEIGYYINNNRCIYYEVEL